MIALLTGKPVLLSNERLVIMVGGVGYGVNVGTSTLVKVGHLDQVTLYIHTHVREESLELSGFSDAQTQDIFQLLLSVSGVGPRIALVLSDLGPDKIIQAVQTADITFFSKVPRVGKKLAQKIIIELKSKLGSLQELKLGARTPIEQDVIEALQALGFTDTDINRGLEQIDWAQSDSASVIVTQVIKTIGKRV